jgi:hypothetical protein
MDKTSNQIKDLVEKELVAFYTVTKACVLTGEVTDDEMKSFISDFATGLTRGIQEIK